MKILALLLVVAVPPPTACAFIHAVSPSRSVGGSSSSVAGTYLRQGIPPILVLGSRRSLLHTAADADADIQEAELLDLLKSSAPVLPKVLPRAALVLDRFVTSVFPLWVVLAALTGKVFPSALAWFGKGNTISLALSATMVCMGMTLKVDDFRAVARDPLSVAIGVALQYSIMPIAALLSARLWGLPPSLYAGACLVGCCPGGTASNLVTLIAGADVALSVSMTTVSTLMAPIVTPILTSLLVGGVVSLDSVGLARSTASVILLPVALGLLLSTYARPLTDSIAPFTPAVGVILVSIICGAVVSQSSTVAAASVILPTIATMLTLHAGGFLLGFLAARRFGMGVRSARTTSIEVGMQNSALASHLARIGFADPLTALPGAVSATIHSVMGSALAALWRYQDSRNPLAS